ncbi:HMG box family protein [Trichomonas vaginalis G3]|uniref:HMG box family protein n=1 Tax=Trichomonas vaginalis (strain ATCC PRA-98 / G3) TaxID=412133 RepID=A2EUL5_TRIV3|nr:HMG-box family [Trichomonas vaginalis G3]EAY03664.1 HMG box family protein [Trichomonas vaginalis G3]KAI5520282.1 HMG-box family [Trichomonas vaginalis G3]|eukprot:XP_001315887.1 HMG box family protein [Trichomonas vaginalis G3]
MSAKVGNDSAVEDEGYSVFLQETKAKLILFDPNLTKLEIYNKAADLWHKQPTKAKMEYRRKSRLRLPRKKKSDGSDSELGFDNEAKPKRISAYSVFVNEKQQELKLTNPDLTLIERSKLIKEIWNSMSKMERSHYENRAKCFNRNLDKYSSDD